MLPSPQSQPSPASSPAAKNPRAPIHPRLLPGASPEFGGSSSSPPAARMKSLVTPALGRPTHRADDGFPLSLPHPLRASAHPRSGSRIPAPAISPAQFFADFRHSTRRWGNPVTEFLRATGPRIVAPTNAPSAAARNHPRSTAAAPP